MIYEVNKLYKWRELGILTDNDAYYAPAPNGYVMIDVLPGTTARRLSHRTLPDLAQSPGRAGEPPPPHADPPRLQVSVARARAAL